MKEHMFCICIKCNSVLLIFSVECCIKSITLQIRSNIFQQCLVSEILVIKCKCFSICVFVDVFENRQENRMVQYPYDL